MLIKKEKKKKNNSLDVWLRIQEQELEQSEMFQRYLDSTTIEGSSRNGSSSFDDDSSMDIGR